MENRLNYLNTSKKRKDGKKMLNNLGEEDEIEETNNIPSYKIMKFKKIDQANKKPPPTKQNLKPTKVF